MLETVAVPILLKAVEWLFGEGSKILEERRERRKAQQEATEGGSIREQSDVTKSLATPVKPAEVIQSKHEALSQPVIGTSWRESEDHITHLLSLLEIHKKNYYLAKEQYAKWGSALVPPIIVSNLIEAEDEIVKTTMEMQATLSKVYGKTVANPELKQV